MTGPWPIPVEVIKRLASPTGVSSIIKASLRGAVLKPMGRISIRGGHFINDPDRAAYMVARAALLTVRGRRGERAAAEVAFRLGDEMVSGETI